MLAVMSYVSDRRAFLRTTGILAGAAIVKGSVPLDLLALQANSADARRAQMGGMPIVTTKLTDALALLSGPGGNVIVFHGPGGTLVVDGFVKPAWPKLTAALQAMGAWPVKSIVDTHWHFDHADNNGNFHDAGAGVIAHENTEKRLSEPHDLLGLHFEPVPRGELPTQTFGPGLTLNLNGEQVDLTHVPPAHTDTDIFVRFPKANVLHMGDVFFNGQYPIIDAGTGGHINGIIDGAAAALKVATAQTRIVPGHGPLATRQQLETYRTVVATIRDRVGGLKASGKSLADVQAAKPSAEFDAAWGKGMLPPNDFVALVYNTVR
jgi:cyclase